MKKNLPLVTVMAVLLFGAVAGASIGRGNGGGVPYPLGAATMNYSGELTIAIQGLRSSAGTVLIGLYDSKTSFKRAIELAGEAGFLNDPDRIAGAALKANAALTGAVTFSNLASGRYAVIVFHDENGNGMLDRNAWGVPTEPYGFSNDARGFLGPPSFEDAMFKIEAGSRAMNIALVYHDLDGEATLARSQPSGSSNAFLETDKDEETDK